VLFPDAESPSLYGNLLAYQDGEGVKVVRWTTRDVIWRQNGPFSKPALGWPWLVFRKDLKGDRHSLYLRNLKEGTVLRLATGERGVEIGRPSIAGDRIAWHVSGEHQTRIVLYRISTGARTWPLRSEIALLSNPALAGGYLLWSRDLPSGSTLFVRRLGGERVRRVVSVRRPGSPYWFWTTDLRGRTGFVTRWNTRSGISRILRERF
jgi:hypothetical protein